MKNQLMSSQDRKSNNSTTNNAAMPHQTPVGNNAAPYASEVMETGYDSRIQDGRHHNQHVVAAAAGNMKQLGYSSHTPISVLER